MNMRGERRGGVAQRLARRGEDRERGVMGRGKAGLEKITSGGNKGGQMGKNRTGRVEEWGEPSAAASVRIGHLDQMMRYGNKPIDNGVAGPAQSLMYWD
jgi:hypothetical protein